MLITFDIIIPLKRTKAFKRYVYKCKDGNFGGLQELYILWDTACDENDMDSSTIKRMDFFLAVVNDYVPKIEKKSANSAPWIDAKVFKAIRKKKKLRKRSKKSFSEYSLGNISTASCGTQITYQMEA